MIACISIISITHYSLHTSSLLCTLSLCTIVKYSIIMIPYYFPFFSGYTYNNVMTHDMALDSSLLARLYNRLPIGNIILYLKLAIYLVSALSKILIIIKGAMRKWDKDYLHLVFVTGWAACGCRIFRMFTHNFQSF